MNIPSPESAASRATEASGRTAPGSREPARSPQIRVLDSTPRIDASHLPAAGSSQRSPKDQSLQIRLQKPEPSLPPLQRHELDALFAAAQRDDAEAVNDLLRRTEDPNVLHPDTRKSLLRVAAEACSPRVVEKLEEFEDLVDPPVKAAGETTATRTAEVAARHAQAFDPVLMSKWHWLSKMIDGYDGGGTGAKRHRRHSSLEVFGKVSRRLLSPSPARTSQDSDNEPFALEKPEVLMERLAALLGRLPAGLIRMREISVPETVWPYVSTWEFVEPDFNDHGTRALFKKWLENEGPVLQGLTQDLGRWDDFIDRLRNIALRPLADPNLDSGTVQDSATLSQDGSAEPLIASLKERLAALELPPMDEQTEKNTTEALNRLINERTATQGHLIPMTRQQVLMAQALFEQLPDDLLRDEDSLLREIRKVLAEADEEYRGRRALREKVDFVLAEARASREDLSKVKKIDLAAVRRFRAIDRYLALDAQDPKSLKLHPGHLLAACLTLSRKYAGRRDLSDIGRLNLFKALGDTALAKVVHAELRILEASAREGSRFGLASGHVGPDLPNTLLYRESLHARAEPPRGVSGTGTGSRTVHTPTSLLGATSPRRWLSLLSSPRKPDDGSASRSFS